MSSPTQNSSKVLGIDPGYGRCGFAIIEEIDRAWRAVTHGVITTPPKTPFPERLLEIATDIESIIDAHKPRLLVMEELFFAKSTTTALQVAEVRGVILFLAQKHGVNIVEVKPNEVKLAMTGYGKADKAQVQEMVKTVYGLKQVPKPDDAADALAVAWTGAHRARYA